MHAPIVLALIVAVLLVASIVLAAVDFIIWRRYMAREAREFAFRRHVRPNHMVYDALGDPITCRDTTHNHNPQDFEARFRARPASVARAVILFFLVIAAAILVLIAGGLALARLFI